MLHVTRRCSRAAHLSVAGLPLAITAACFSDNNLSATTLFVYGPGQALGQGTARTYLARGAAGAPTALGVALSEAALTGLPQTPLPGGPSAVNLTLQLLQEARETGFDHVMLDWNPGGHEPEHVYTLPHFDFHFFLTSPAERDAIMPSDPAWATKAASFPPAGVIPAAYAAGSTLGGLTPAAAVPMMGLHWLDVKSPELQPLPNNKPFTATFIYGFVGREDQFRGTDGHQSIYRVLEGLDAGCHHADQRRPGPVPRAVRQSLGPHHGQTWRKRLPAPTHCVGKGLSRGHAAKRPCPSGARRIA